MFLDSKHIEREGVRYVFGGRHNRGITPTLVRVTLEIICFFLMRFSVFAHGQIEMIQ